MVVNLDQVRGSITLTGSAEAPQVVTSLESTPAGVDRHALA